MPCLNGGKCVEGPKMYRCECAPGYRGADCQFEIDECAANPCPRGMECVDLVGTFDCRCPPGTFGENCERKHSSCSDGETIHQHGEKWTKLCNTCTCSNGKSACTEDVCSPSNCYDQKSDVNCTCVTKLDADCITPPCGPWGECLRKEALSSEETCLPDAENEQLSKDCAKLVIAFERLSLPQGTYVESICEEFLRLTLSQTYTKSNELRLKCSRSNVNSNINILNVSVFSRLNAAHVALELAKTFNFLSSRDNILHSLSRGVINVTVERHTRTSQLTQSQIDSSFLIPLAGGTASLALLLLFILIIFAYKRRQKAEDLGPEIYIRNIYTKKKNVFQKTVEKNTNRERSISKGDPQCELLDPNMYFDEPVKKKFMPIMLGARDDLVV